ncbi:hypothetical protein SAE02_73320 [Skermanella aerolata]|uniref:Uncharacterized protein n=1 Tax=Skermanella aerolata TaxID=393310 RepID=A0A512E384_9PROT|nr:hypothetical protein N826_36540 [Skermanella aerolata KACC 11604]GEO43184.1 hypothetical protein SAE02_73320 [Skermanella aerolata]
MGWVLRLVETGVEGSSRSVDVMVIDHLGDLADIAALGLTLAQGKQLVAVVQQNRGTVGNFVLGEVILKQKETLNGPTQRSCYSRRDP